jgi:hypothetical protein
MGTENKSLAAQRFRVPIDQCDVHDKANLVRYREHWLKWMSWYEHTAGEPHSIESQIQRMIFNDLAYRATVSVRGSVSSQIAISARTPTLAYLLDQGYVLSQILAIQKLLDNRADVISIRRLLNDVEKNYGLITREAYVSGDGTPYDYNSWTAVIPQADPTVQIWGLEAPVLARYALSKQLHDRFDLLSGGPAGQRARSDTIRQSVFQTLNSWISSPSAQQIRQIRNKFLAHASDAVSRGSLQFAGVKFTEIDELQRAIIRVERALTDYILSIRVVRDVVPLQPLGMFKGLDLPYAPSEAQDSMHKRWDELKVERNAWKDGVSEELAKA